MLHQRCDDLIRALSILVTIFTSYLQVANLTTLLEGKDINYKYRKLVETHSSDRRVSEWIVITRWNIVDRQALSVCLEWVSFQVVRQHQLPSFQHVTYDKCPSISRPVEGWVVRLSVFETNENKVTTIELSWVAFSGAVRPPSSFTE